MFWLVFLEYGVTCDLNMERKLLEVGGQKERRACGEEIRAERNDKNKFHLQIQRRTCAVYLFAVFYFPVPYLFIHL